MLSFFISLKQYDNTINNFNPASFESKSADRHISKTTAVENKSRFDFY